MEKPVINLNTCSISVRLMAGLTNLQLISGIEGTTNVLPLPSQMFRAITLIAVRHRLNPLDTAYLDSVVFRFPLLISSNGGLNFRQPTSKNSPRLCLCA
jgi:hypothetical protein